MKNDYFQDEKLKYDEIEVPDELLFTVRRAIAADRKKKALQRRRRILKTVVSAAAVWFLCLTIGVNSSYAFAEAAVKIPVVKSMAQAMVIRSYKPEIAAVYEEHKTNRRTEKEPEEVPEKQPETVLVENDEDNGLLTLSGSAGSEEGEQIPAATPEGLDAWKAEMTVEKLREVTEPYEPGLEEKYADTPEKLRTILLAELPEKDISLYGYHESGSMAGTALRVKDKHQYFDWNYMNASRKMPEISCKDMDGDGTEEILVFLYNGIIPEDETAKETPKETPVEEKTDSEDTANTPDVAEAANTADTANGTDPVNPSDTASGNDVTKTPEPVSENKAPDAADSKENAETEQGRPAGELWVISLTGDVWSASPHPAL